VKTHVGRIMQKLEVRDRVELVLLAVQAGLVEETV
jgi:DNA-binding NarL/FixJ family response regulator